MSNVSRNLVVLALIALSAACVTARFPSDGKYYGYEPLPNLSPEEPDCEWYRAVELSIAGSKVHIEKYPRARLRGVVTASASDGGFPVLEGTLKAVQGLAIVRIGQVSCDYCEHPEGDPFSPKIPREYVLFWGPDATFELDHVKFSTSRRADMEVVVGP